MADSKWSERKKTSRANLKAANLEEKLHKWKEHFKNLHEKHPEIADKLMQQIVNGQLDIKLGQFTEEEFDTVLKKEIKNRKAVGLDKILPEVWKTRKFDNIQGAFNKFPDFFVQAFKIVIDSWKIHYVIAIHLMRWLTNFYDFRFKWTATVAIGIHPTKTWLSQLVNFKNAISTWGHFRRMICNKILF